MRRFVRTGVLIVFCVLAAPALATTIDTFSFSQSGYANAGTLSGSFIADVPTNGFIEQADLISFADKFTAPNLGATLFGNSTTSFSFNAGPYSLAALGPTADSTLDFVGSISLARVCVGASAAFGLCGGPGGVNGYVVGFGGFTTLDFPTLLLTASETTTAPPSVISTPEPPALWLFVFALTGIAAAAYLRRRPVAGPHL